MQSTAGGTNPATEAWQSNDLSVQVGLQRVLQAGKPVELPRLSFELLLTLLRAAPHFVSNEELMARVWRGLVVSPETVTQRVKLLRDALADDPRQPRYIEGLRGRGYRWIPEARQIAAGDVKAAATAEVADTAVLRPIAPRPWLAWAIALAIAVAASAWLITLPTKSVSQGPVTEADRTAAILPFEVVGSVPQGPELAIGMADNVQSQLAGIQGLTVIARYSSFEVGAARLGARATGKRLGARYLIEGSMQRSAGQLRVIAKLVDAETGRLLWTGQFDRDSGEFFALQDAVARGIARALEKRIAGLDASVPSGGRSRDVQAQLAFLRGRALLGRTTVEGSRAAEREFELALQRDPQFAQAMVGMYDARLQATSLLRTGLNAARADNAALLSKAVALEPASGAAQLARAMWGADERDTRAALFEQGLKQDPANARAMTAYSELLDAMDRREDAARWLEQALRIDPLWPRARFRAAQRNFPNVGSAIEQQTQKLLEQDPNYYPALQRQAKYRWQLHGEIFNAISIIERAIAADPDNPWAPHTAVAFYLDAGDPEAAEQLARRSPVVDASTAAVRALYAGDVRRAGEAALAPGSFEFGAPERWGVPMALRDYALQGGPRDRVLRTMQERYGLPVNEPWTLTSGNFREALMLAHVLIASGRRGEGLRRVDEVIAWIDANGYMGPVYNLRTKAQALALKGQNDAALALLAESFEKLDYTQWWYTLEHDPLWTALRGDPRFLAIAGTVRAHIAGERARLDTARSAGQTPQRRP